MKTSEIFFFFSVEMILAQIWLFLLAEMCVKDQNEHDILMSVVQN